MTTVPDLTALSREIRRTVLDQSRRANVGHIGSCLSIADIIAVLYGTILRVESPHDPDRDRFVLSKGHAGLALFAAFRSRGWITAAELDSFCANASRLGVHPEHWLTGVDFSTGSLGHGLPMGVGAALGARMQGSERRTFVLVSDAECNEGATWEAVMFAAHHRLANLVVVIDVNGQQALGRTREVLDLEPMARCWSAFGWQVDEVDGHDTKALSSVLTGLDTTAGRPHVVVAHTVFGKGVSFMEGQVKWHYLPMSEEEHSRARMEIGDLGCAEPLLPR